MIYAARIPGGLTKIGFTDVDLEIYLKYLRRVFDLPDLEMVWTGDGNLEEEHRLHVALEEFWIGNEWFDFGDRDPVTEIESKRPTILAEGPFWG